MLSKIQKNIVESKDSKIIVCAGSGSGKTRVLTERVKKILNDGVDPKSVVVITFTNMAANELYTRLEDVPNSNKVFIGTIHAYANKLLKKTGYDYDIFSEYYQTLYMTALIPKYAHYCTMDDYNLFVKLERKASAGMMQKSKIKDNFTDFKVYNELLYLLGREHNQSYTETVVTLCKRNNVITFDELIKLATQYFTESNTKLEYLFVDELQDIGYLEYDFLMSLNATNCFFIGDDYQCQPEGTNVLMEDGTLKDIKDIEIGDKVTSRHKIREWYYARCRKSRGKSVTDKQISFSDTLIDIETESGIKTSYTPNHRCFARFKFTEETKNYSSVWLVEHESGLFKLCCKQLFLKDAGRTAILHLMSKYNYTRAWLLKACSSMSEARDFLHECSETYEIPNYATTSFNEDISSGALTYDDLRERAIHLLKDLNKDIKYPLCSNEDRLHFTSGSTKEIRACNLVPEVMNLIVPKDNGEDTFNHFDTTFDTIKRVSARHGNFEVYSLKIADTENYIADGILTHNSIFAFKGGDVNIFLNLMNSSDWKSYFLTDNYRTPSSVLMYADSIVQKADNIIKKTPICQNKEKGSLEFQTKSTLEKFLTGLKPTDDWFILTRTNKEMTQVDAILRKNNIDHYCFKQSNTTFKKTTEIMSKPCIKVMTIHSAKGLECDNVALYGKLPIKGKGESDELKVFYVGLTRTKNRCVVFI